eukprot:5055410-Pleurochrysis_carterae.AAC.1
MGARGSRAVCPRTMCAYRPRPCPPAKVYSAPALRLPRVFPARAPTPPPVPAPCSLTGRSRGAPIRRTWPR